MEANEKQRLDDVARIQWPPRVSREKIRQLYETDAKGIYDEELIDDVGWALRSRCDSLLAARVGPGHARCHGCGATLPRTDPICCDKCGWSVSFGAYYKSIKGKQFSLSPAAHVAVQKYAQAFPKATEPREKMRLIDLLIHRCHGSLEEAETAHGRPLACNLIEGKLGQLIAFLDTLAYGEKSTQGTRETYTKWREQNIFVAERLHRTRREAG